MKIKSPAREWVGPRDRNISSISIVFPQHRERELQHRRCSVVPGILVLGCSGLQQRDLEVPVAAISGSPAFQDP